MARRNDAMMRPTSVAFETKTASLEAPTAPTEPPPTKVSSNQSISPASSSNDLEAPSSPDPLLSEVVQDDHVEEQLRSSQVPSSKLSRLAGYGSLALGLGVGTSTETLRRLWRGKGSSSQSSALMSEANVRRIVDKLSKMRGAALKIGQFLSIQDSHSLPPQVAQILQRVQNRANYMPEYQTKKVLQSQFGSDWAAKFASFDMTPFASASIGQVHRAKLEKTQAEQLGLGARRDLAVKIQFPGVKNSISSDIAYLKWLLIASVALPKGLFLENTLKVLEMELNDECNYVREAEVGSQMRSNIVESPSLRNAFDAPVVLKELSTEMVLTTEFVHGVPMGSLQPQSQDIRDKAGSDLLNLCLHELFVFNLMQTDPNWSNFLYNSSTRKIVLVDFGATRAYTRNFIANYKALMLAAIDEKRQDCLDISRDLGYLTGQENEAMLESHLASLYALATPFRQQPGGSPFPFGTRGREITERVRAQIPVMLKNRLSPPPQETYSLNRKLSGIFLLCEALGSRVDARALLDKVLTE